jgi:hypothetical protein
MENNSVAKPVKSCDNCLFRTEEWRDGGHCYFWRKPTPPCHQYQLVTITAAGNVIDLPSALTRERKP